MVNNRSIIVLGGFGFIGQRVVSELKRQKYRAIPLSRRNGCDVSNIDQFTKILKKQLPYAVINCAAHVGSVHYALQYGADLVYDNIRIVTGLYESVKRACPTAKIINPISNCSYPGEATLHSEPDWQNGPVHDSVLSFASTRRMIHAFSHCYRQQYGIASINWFIANAYGPGDYTDPNKVHALNGILIRLIQAQKRGDTTFEIWGSGKPLREWVYVADVAKILAASVRLDEQIYPLNFGQHKAYSIAQIAEIGAKILHFKVKFIFNRNYPDGAMVKILDDQQFRENYPTFKFTPLDDGVKNTTQYYKKLL